MLCPKYIVKIPVHLKLMKYAHSKGQKDDGYDDIQIAGKEKSFSRYETEANHLTCTEDTDTYAGPRQPKLLNFPAQYSLQKQLCQVDRAKTDPKRKGKEHNPENMS